MKIYFPFLVICFSFLSLASCKNDQKKEMRENEKQQEEELVPKTYAEISIKKGGVWEDRKYVGGTFKNVTEISLPKEHSDHSDYIRYEGPGWENPQVAYRLYLDWRNAIDVFGKKVDTMVLANVGTAKSGSYHEMENWGMDILKAGKSLGLGGFGRYVNDTVAHFRNVESTLVKIENSKSSSSIKINYQGWKTGDQSIDLSAALSIYPKDRYTKVELSPSTDLENLTTGIVKSEETSLLQKGGEQGKWAYIATYGNKTLAGENDKLGMVIFYKNQEVTKILEGPHDHLIVFKPGIEVTYYFLAAWEQEKNGINSKEEFLADIDSKLNTLDEKGKL